MSANILNGKEIAQDIFEEVYLKVSKLKKKRMATNAAFNKSW